MSDSSTPAVVLLSGGLDSSTLLHHVCRNLGHDPVYTLAFNYGQRHDRELDCAQWQANAAGALEHRVLDVSFLGELVANGTSLVRGGTEVPDLNDVPDADRAQPSTYVPNRNMMLLSMAAAFAEAQDVCDVFYGAQAQDGYGYWDCTTGFIERLNATLALNRRKPITIHAPFAAMRKSESLRIGLALGVDYAHTWSCYRGGAKACGICPTCVERLRAFEEAGEVDPLEYKILSA